MRIVKAMIAVALLLDGAMVLHHERAQHANAVEQAVNLTADAGDSSALVNISPQR